MTILERAKPAEDIGIQNYLNNVLLIGKSGTGKSTGSAISLPKPLLFLDYDNRSESLAGIEGIDILKVLPNPRDPMKWREVEQITEELWTRVRNKDLKYKSVHEAGLSAMNRMAMYWALLLDPKRGLGGSPARQHFGPQIKNLQDHIQSMIALPVNYVLEAHYNLVEDEETGETTYFPLMYGRIARAELSGMFNECYHSFHKTDREGKQRYYWHTSGFGRFDFMKSSLNNPAGKYWTDPIEIDLAEQVTGFQKLLELRFGREEERTAL